MTKLSYADISRIWQDHGVFDLLMQKYTDEIEARFDWAGIHAFLDEGESIANEYELEQGYDYSTMFIGTVFNLTPSGKYYTLWACSNVTPKEALMDECWTEALEAVLERHGLWSQAGDGDACDLFFCKHLQRESAKELIG